MATFIMLGRKPANVEHVTHLSEPEQIDGETIVRVYFTDGSTTKLTGKAAEDAYGYFCFVSLPTDFYKQARERITGEQS